MTGSMKGQVTPMVRTPELEKLRAENARLREENKRLKDDMDMLHEVISMYHISSRKPVDIKRM